MIAGHLSKFHTRSLICWIFIQFIYRDIAKELLLKSTVFQKFDRRVLDSYIKYGMIENNNGVTLTTDKVQEAITYLDDLALYESFISLDDVPLTVPILFILASKNNGPAKA